MSSINFRHNIMRITLLLLLLCIYSIDANSEYISCNIQCRMEFIDRCQPTEEAIVAIGDTSTPIAAPTTSSSPATGTTPHKIAEHCITLHKKCQKKCSFRKYCRKINFTKAYCHGAYTNLKRKKKSSNLKLLRKARHPLKRNEDPNEFLA